MAKSVYPLKSQKSFFIFFSTSVKQRWVAKPFFFFFFFLGGGGAVMIRLHFRLLPAVIINCYIFILKNKLAFSGFILDTSKIL